MSFQKYILIYANGNEEQQKADLFTTFQQELKKHDLEHTIQVVKAAPSGHYPESPLVKILPDGTVYHHVSNEDVAELVKKHLVDNQYLEHLLFKASSGPSKKTCQNINVYNKQHRIVLRNCGVINPEVIEEYIARDGYAALEKVLFDMSSDDVIEELKTAGIRGRGGAGFPTWKKWLFTKQVEASQKYVICNADEGDPGAYMDRGTLEGDPHSVLEAMTIAGHTIGANKGIIYIRIEYPLAIKRLEIALGQAHKLGLLGENILGSGFDFDIEIRYGAGAFVCGEETALIKSAEGNRGMPIPRPPYPSVKGMWGKPTIINNVETLTNIPMIILNGGDWFSKIGTETSKGTKVFALTGKINNPGLVEVPMGTTLREVIYQVGGGVLSDKKFKAVQTGGPSGGVIPEKDIDTPIDYENLQALGSIMGSGGMIVIDENDCIVDVIKFYLGFSVDESCGKCAPCRIGTRTLYNIFQKIAAGQGNPEDIEKIKTVAHTMKKASLCGLGQAAPNPVVSALNHFNEEIQAHINEKRCPAGKCKDMLTYYILPDKCVGCTLCARNCPVDAIKGERQQTHVIDQNKCIKCGKCYKVCKFDAITRE
ncbi:MAG: NADH-ubiquinone oxidoreductase-F iron-sulfur binding region domain-containing protein [Chlamydiota bacterium]